MNPEQNKFKIILMVVFGFFIFLGIIVFSTYKSSSSVKNNVSISVWGTVDATAFNSFLDKFKQDKGLQFRLDYTQKSPSTIDSELVEAIATGKSPDVILVSQELIKRYLDKVLLLTSIQQRDFMDTFIQEAEIYLEPSGVFALPFFVDPLVMYWNRDSFSSALIANPPTQWSEFPLLASKLTQSDNNANIVKSAVSLGEYRNINNGKAILSTIMMQAGSPIVAQNNGVFSSYLYNRSQNDLTAPAVSALNFFTEYSNPKKSVYSWNRSLPSSKQSFLSENLAIYFGFASEYADITKKNPNLNFDVAMMPQTVGAKTKITFGELYGFAFLKSSPNILPAYNLISILTSADAVNEFLQFENAAPARRDLISSGSSDPAKSVFYDSALISKGWVDPDAVKTDGIFQSMVEDVTTGRLSSNDSVQKASEQLDSLLQ